MHTEELSNYFRILGEICSDFCPPDKYCLLKEMILSLKSSPRTLIQLKCVEKYKYEESQKQGQDIGWNEATIKWAEHGYAKIFSEIYNDKDHIVDIYNKVISIKKQRDEMSSLKDPIV